MDGEISPKKSLPPSPPPHKPHNFVIIISIFFIFFNSGCATFISTWKEEAENAAHLMQKMRNQLCLSTQTIEGITITSKHIFHNTFRTKDRKFYI